MMEQLQSIKSTPKTLKGSEKVGALQSKTKEGVSRILQAMGIGVLAAVGLSVVPMLTAIAGGALIGAHFYKKNK